MTKAIVIKIFEVSKSYRVAPSRKGAHRQLAIMMLTSDTPEQTTLSGELGYLVARELRCQMSEL